MRGGNAEMRLRKEAGKQGIAIEERSGMSSVSRTVG